MSNNSDIIFVGMEEWDNVWRRSQNLISRVACNRRERQILFVALPHDLTHLTRRGRWGEAVRHVAPQSPSPVPLFDNLFVFKPIKYFVDSLPLGRWLNQLSYRRQIRRAARSLSIRRPILWIKPHWAAHLVGRMQEIAVLYDVGDDWSTLTMSRRARQRVLAEDGLLTRTADAVVVVSKELRQPKLKVRPDVQLVPNGVDVECYLVVGDEQTPTHPLVKDWKRPVFGHTGTLHPDRTDVNLVLKLARRMPTATIALVGPNMLKREQTAMLEEQPNIVLTGSVRHDELPQIMHAMDVFIVPHLVNDVSGSQNPLKLWEYLAAGRPTVATNVAGFRDYPHLVHMAEEAEAFVREAVRLAETGDNLTEARRAEAAKHTWSRRVNQIEAVLDSLAPQARPEAGTADQFDHGVAAVHDVETPERGRSGENG